MPLPLITPEAMGMTEAEQRQAAAWFLALKAATRKPGIGPTAQHAIQRWAAEESAQEQPLELTVNQLGRLAKLTRACSPKLDHPARPRRASC